MNTLTRLAAFATGLVVVFAGAAGIGNAVGPVGTTGKPAAHGGHTTVPDQVVVPAAGRPLAGLSASQDGYTLDVATATLPVGRPAAFEFRIAGPDGKAVTRYNPKHGKDLHLIVVRRDTSGFQHLHPVRDDDGRWALPLTLPAAGVYKVYADFAPDSRTEALTLAADISAAGQYEPQPLPQERRSSMVAGYQVILAGTLMPGEASKLTLSVRKNGAPVHDLQPYLAAYGHLVALRTADLAYLHVHPDGEPGDGRTPSGPDITFYADVPAAGSYRLYLDFRHDGVVRTAEFTATTSGTRPPLPPSDRPTSADTHDATPHGH